MNFFTRKTVPLIRAVENFVKMLIYFGLRLQLVHSPLHELKYLYFGALISPTVDSKECLSLPLSSKIRKVDIHINPFSVNELMTICPYELCMTHQFKRALKSESIFSQTRSCKIDIRN